ncbi:unnamed protein product [Closterium sp. NIES-64]|nr:unnamed protein product [Closterium sp. NIES-64]
MPLPLCQCNPTGLCCVQSILVSSQCMEQQQGGQRVELTYPIHKSPSRRSVTPCSFIPTQHHFHTAVQSILVASQCMEQQQGGQRSILVGSQCMEQQQGGQRVELTYPIHNGVVQRWDDMGHVWDYTFNTALKIDPSESKILLTDPPLNPTKNRQRMLQMMFEKYNFDSLFIQLQAVLPLYAQGILTGLVVDSGESATHAVPVVEGFAYPHLTKRISIAGRQITSHLIDLMMRRGYPFSKVSDFEAARAIKEQLCFVR